MDISTVINVCIKGYQTENFIGIGIGYTSHFSWIYH